MKRGSTGRLREKDLTRETLQGGETDNNGSYLEENERGCNPRKRLAVISATGALMGMTARSFPQKLNKPQSHSCHRFWLLLWWGVFSFRLPNFHRDFQSLNWNPADSEWGEYSFYPPTHCEGVDKGAVDVGYLLTAPKVHQSPLLNIHVCAA